MKNSTNSHLFLKTSGLSSYLPSCPDAWHSASDEQHLEAMNQSGYINPKWIKYLENYRPHLIGEHLQRCKQQRGM